MDGTEPTWEYRVIFRNVGAPHPLARIVQTSSGVAALLERLAGRGATVKTVERRRVGRWIEMGAR